MSFENVKADLSVILIEIIVLVVLVGALYWLLSRGARLIFSLPALSKYQGAATAVRRSLRRVLALGGLLLVLGVAGVNAFLMASSEELLPYTRGLIEGIPRDFWVGLGIAVAKILGLIVVIALAVRFLHRLIGQVGARAMAYEGVQANDESVDQFFQTLKRVVARSAWLLVVIASARWLAVPAYVTAALLVVFKIYLILALSRLVWRALDAIVATLDALAHKYADSKGLIRYYRQLEALVPLFRRTVEYVIYLVAATLVVSQLEMTAGLAEWGPRLISILGLFFLSRVAIELANLVVEEVLVTRPKLSSGEKKRRATFVPLVRSGLKWGIYFVFGIFALRQLGIDPTPVLAGAGILTLAVGLGAQNLITDLVAGLFILFEEYYLVGDFIETGSASGVVDSIDLRTTRIRDPAGRYHILRNGQIKEVINYSKEYTCALVTVGVAYDSDLGEVFAALTAVGEKIHSANDDVLEPSEVQGVEELGESEIVVRLLTRVKPGRHNQVRRDIRKLIKEEFDTRGIEIPFARRVVLLRTGDGEPIDLAAS